MPCEHYQLGPCELHAWGQHWLLKASINGTGNLMSHNRARFGDDWQPGRGMPMAWVPAHLQRHVPHQRITGLPTTVEFATRLRYGNHPELDPICPLCGREQEDEEHAWRCSKTIRTITKLRDMLLCWLEDHLYMDGECARALENEIYSPTCMVIWAMATKTQGLAEDHVGTASRDSLGTQFLIKAVAASAKLWSERYKLRDRATRRRHGMNIRGRSQGNESEEDVGSGGEEPQEGQAEEEEDPAAEPHMMEL